MPGYHLAKGHKRRHQVEQPAVQQRPLTAPCRNPPKLLEGRKPARHKMTHPVHSRVIPARRFPVVAGRYRSCDVPRFQRRQRDVGVVCLVRCRPAAGAGNLAAGCRLPVAIRRRRNCPASAAGAFAPRRKTRYNTHSTSRVRGEGSHSGLVRAPAKRLSWETGIVGSNPTPSAILYPAVIGPLAPAPGISNGAGNGNGNRTPGAHRNLPSCRLITSGPSAAR